MEFETQQRDNSALGELFKNEDPKIWMVDLSAGVPAGLHDMITASLREAEANEAVLGFDAQRTMSFT